MAVGCYHKIPGYNYMIIELSGTPVEGATLWINNTDDCSSAVIKIITPPGGLNELAQAIIDQIAYDFSEPSFRGCYETVSPGVVWITLIWSHDTMTSFLNSGDTFSSCYDFPDSMNFAYPNGNVVERITTATIESVCCINENIAFALKYLY